MSYVLQGRGDMTEVVIDRPTRDKLAAVSEPVRIVDTDGNLLGTFQPAENLSHETALLPPMDVDEMRRRAAEPGGRTLPEILNDLEGRA